MLILGIDPGATGAVAVLDADTGTLVEVYDFEQERDGRFKRLLGEPFSQFLGEIGGVYAATLEAMQAMPQDAQRLGSFGSLMRAYGAIEAILDTYAIPTHRVLPRVWKRWYGLIKRDKAASRALVLERYPNAPVTRARDHNRAEAILIAHYGLQEIIKWK